MPSCRVACLIMAREGAHLSLSLSHGAVIQMLAEHINLGLGKLPC